jgi:imidazolonepropionase-like amidohydrolase
MLGIALLLSSAGAGSAAPAVTRDTSAYLVLNHGRPAGAMRVITRGDSVIVQYHHVDRNRGPRSETRYLIRNGAVLGGETWSLPLYGPDPTPRGPPLDRFEVVRDSVRWRLGDSLRTSPLGPASFYRLRSFTPFDQALFARFLLARPDRTAQLLPGGTAKLEIVADTTLRTPAGRQHLRLAMVRGTGGPSSGVWLDDQGALFASEIGWFITVHPENQQLLPALRAIELKYRNAEGERLARRVAPPAATAIAIVNGDLFDSERGVVLPRTTVLIRGDRIAAVGPADSVTVPAGATVIDAAGKTVLPGLWDLHTHLFHTSQSFNTVSQLATGLTTIRDLAADIDVAVSHRDRAAAGLLASPRLILAGFMEGPGRWAGPTEVIVRSEDEALAWIARYDSLGYKQIKLYNLIQPDLVPAIAAEAHRRGMRLSGHVPRGLSTQAAVRLGFDEINHAAFLFSTFFPDSLYLPTMRAYSAVAATVAPNVNVDGPEMTALIELLRQRGTVIDGTFNLWLIGPNPEGSPRPNVTGLPAQTSDSLARKSDASYLRLLKRLFDAGVTLVPGTDGSSYNVELETYERAGIPAPQVLQIATIVSARVMRDNQEYGSIAVGKVADLIVVDGKPAEHIGDLRKVERVIRAGRVYETKTLREALRSQP